jgi:hypothetical protein
MSCHDSILKSLTQFIPSTPPKHSTLTEGAFTRTRKLPFPRLISFILSSVASGSKGGMAVKAAEFVKQARRSGLWPDAKHFSASAVCKARKKLSWKIFEQLLDEVADLADDLWPSHMCDTWHGLRVLAVDGSKHRLPASVELRDAFDPESGLQYSGKGHYPECVVSVLLDVLRRSPIAQTIAPIASSERKALLDFLTRMPEHSITILDRGYYGYEVMRSFIHLNSRHFLLRHPHSRGFAVVKQFLESGKSEQILTIYPSPQMLRTLSEEEAVQREPLQIRAIRMISPDGEVTALLTNLLDTKKYKADDLRNLYRLRWEVETYYRNEKITLTVEQFHSKTENGIRQEFYSAAIMCVIARILIAIERRATERTEPQLKNALYAIGAEAALLCTNNPDAAISVMISLLEQIRQVRNVSRKKSRPNQPRVSKTPTSRWIIGRLKKLGISRSEKG